MRELFTVLLNQLCFYPLAMTAATLLTALEPAVRPKLWLWLLCALPVYALSYARKRCRNFISLCFFHIAALAVVWLLPAETGVNHGFRVLVCAGFVIYSLYLRLRSEDFSAEPLTLPLAAGISIVSLFLQHYQENTAWDTYYRVSLIAVLALYALILFLRSYEDFLQVNRMSTGKIPFREIFRSGMTSSGTFVLLSGGVLLLVSQYAWLKPLFVGMREGLRLLLSFLFRLIPEDTSDPEILQETHMVGNDMPLPEAGEPALFWVILEYAAMVALLAAALFFLWKGAVKLFRYLRAQMQYQTAGSLRNTETVDLRERLPENSLFSGKKTHSDGRRFSLFPDARERIRRSYRKKINNSGLAKDKVPFYTAREALYTLDADSAAQIYEKARYSEEICTEEDVRRMRYL